MTDQAETDVQQNNDDVEMDSQAAKPSQIVVVDMAGGDGAAAAEDDDNDRLSIPSRADQDVPVPGSKPHRGGHCERSVQSAPVQGAHSSQKPQARAKARDDRASLREVSVCNWRSTTREHPEYGDRISERDAALSEEDLELPDHLLDIEILFLKVSAVMLTAMVVCLLIHAAAPDDTPFFAPPTSELFWSALILSPLGVFAAYFVWAFPRVYLGWDVALSRKGTHFTGQIFIFTAILTGADKSVGQETLSDIIAQLILILPYQYAVNFVFLGIIRRRVRLFRFMFKSIDRPEDRPFTVFWNASQTASTITVQLLMGLWMESRDKGILALVPVIIVGLGDGLAEPVGYRWGKHKYKTYGCFTKKTFTRSWEGSFCVWFFSVVALLVTMTAWDNATQLGVAIAIIPIAATFTEAWAWHTLDNVLIYLTVWVLAYVILEAF